MLWPIYHIRNKQYYSASFDVNSGQAIGKDVIECLSLQLLTSSLLETPCSRKTITWAKNYNDSLKLSRPKPKAGNILKSNFFSFIV